MDTNVAHATTTVDVITAAVMVTEITDTAETMATATEIETDQTTADATKDVVAPAFHTHPKIAAESSKHIITHKAI